MAVFIADAGMCLRLEKRMVGINVFAQLKPILVIVRLQVGSRENGLR